MKNHLLLLITMATLVALSSSVHAQEVKPDTSPMTAEQIQRGNLMRAGKIQSLLSPEQIAEYNRKEEEYRTSLAVARGLYREGKYNDAARAYSQIAWGNFLHDRWETAEAYRAAGQPEQAIKWYRITFYQKVKLGSMRGYALSPRAQLPQNATSIEEARRLFPEQEVEVWGDNDTAKLGHFALLLAQHGEYAEAVAVYQEAFRTLSEPLDPEWRATLTLGNISALNFDRRRFESAVYTMMATKGAGIPWVRMKNETPKGADYEQERRVWIEEAVRIKPDYAPALYVKAKILATAGEQKTGTEYAEAKQCLDQAEQYARSEEMRTLIQKLRRDNASRLK